MRSPTIVRIEDLGERPPRIEVAGAPHGHNVYVGPLVNNPSVESGALINLLGVDSSGSLPDQGWRFVDPDLPSEVARNCLYVLWITHDHGGPLNNGDLQIGFNRSFLGRHYANPMHTTDRNLGPVANKWVTIHSDNILVLLFKGADRKSPELDVGPNAPQAPPGVEP